MAITDKLTYLNETKSLIKDRLNDLGSGLTSQSTFRSYADKIGMLYKEWPKSSGEGTSVSLDNTRKAKMVLDFKGQIQQDGEPTPTNPVDIHIVSGDNEIKVCNKNLFDESNRLKGYYDNNGTIINGSTSRNTIFYIKCEPNTSYSLSAKANIDLAILNFTYTSELPNYGVSVGQTTTFNLTTLKRENYITPSTAQYIVIRMQSSIGSNIEDADINNFITDFQLEKGSTATAYVPHQEYTKEINLPVENLCSSILANHTMDSTGKVTTNSSYSLGIGQVKANGTYTFSGIDLESSSIVGFFQDMPVYGSQTYNSGRTVLSDNNRTFVAPITGYVAFRITNIATNIQLEKSTKANSYTPYGTTPIEVGGIGEYEDEFFKNTTDSEYYDNTLEQDKWYLKKKIGKKILTGANDENWLTQENVPSTSSSTLIKPFYFGKDKYYSNYFIYGNRETYNHLVLSYGDMYLRLTYDISGVTASDDNNTILTKMKNWLSTHNTIVYYVLETPENILLNDTLQETLDSFYSWQEQTNIMQENNDLPFVIGASALMG